MAAGMVIKKVEDEYKEGRVILNLPSFFT